MKVVAVSFLAREVLRIHYKKVLFYSLEYEGITMAEIQGLFTLSSPDIVQCFKRICGRLGSPGNGLWACETAFKSCLWGLLLGRDQDRGYDSRTAEALANSTGSSGAGMPSGVFLPWSTWTSHWMWAGRWRGCVALGRQHWWPGATPGEESTLPASEIMSTSALKWDPIGGPLPPLHSLRDHESTCPWDWQMTARPQMATYVNTKLNWSIFCCCSCCGHF